MAGSEAKQEAADIFRRARRTQRIGAVAARVAAPALKKRGLTNAELLVSWHHIVGSYFAHHLLPTRVTWPRGRGDCGVLHLTVAPGLATAVQHETPRLIERINGFFGHAAIARIKLTAGAIPTIRPEHPRLRMPAPAPESSAVAAFGEGPLHDALARLERHLPQG